MSHSLLHQEKRRVRAKLRAKENRIIRNSPHLITRGSQKIHLDVQHPRSPGFWGSIWSRMQSLLHSLDLSVRKIPVQEVIHGRGWLKRQQGKEAHKKQRSKGER
ncbi:hypothetical protein ES703_93252 [subsurface metagenome]